MDDIPAHSQAPPDSMVPLLAPTPGPPPRVSTVRQDWLPLAGAIGGLAGLTGLVYAVGGAVMWSRLRGAGAAADEALGAIPQQTLFAIGARQLMLPAAMAVGLFALAVWLERHASRPVMSRPTQRPANSDAPERTRARRTRRWMSRGIDAGRVCLRSLRRLVPRWARRWLRQAATSLWKPVRWYLAHVPPWIAVWLPLVLFLPDPIASCIVALNVTAAAAVGSWVTTASGSWRRRTAIAAASLAVITAGTTLLHEWNNPAPLPLVLIDSQRSRTTARFVSVEGGEAYVVQNGRLTILPSSSFERLVVIPAHRPDDPARDPSIVSRILP